MKSSLSSIRHSLRFATLVAATMLLPPLALAQTPATQPPAADTQKFSPDQRRDIENIIKDYLVQHPEVLQEAMDALDKRQKQADADKARTTIKDNNATIFNSAHQVVLGNPKGNVTMVEFFDYNCGYCKRALPDMVDLIKTNSDLRFVLKEFPVLGEGSVEAAHVAVAARMQDSSGAKYLEFHQKLLGGRGPADKAHALAAAKDSRFRHGAHPKGHGQRRSEDNHQRKHETCRRTWRQRHPELCGRQRSRRRRGRDR